MNEKPISILAQVRREAYFEGFRDTANLSNEDAYERGREEGYHEARVPLWHFFALFLGGVAVGAMLL